MKTKHSLINILNIKPGESKPIALLLGFSFFMGAAIAFFYTAATTLLLAGFETTILPWVYIISGIIGYVVWFLSSYMEKRHSFPSLMRIYLIFLTSSVLIFAIVLNIFSTPWIAFLMFIWIRIFTFITAVVFWGVAARLFNLRQGKRLFGLISSGEVLSNIIGFLSIPLLMRFIITPTLVIIAFTSLVFCLIFLLLILSRFKDKLQKTKEVLKAEVKETTRPKIKYDKYFKLLFLMALLPMFSIYFIDYIFLYQTKVEFTDKEVLASFLGLFLGFVAIAELLIKTFATGRLISKYGLKLGLSALPIMMFFSTFLASLSGTLYGVTAMFFSFVLLSKLFERALRSSINDPAFQILYQPIPQEERFLYQSRIEGIPKALGNTLAGIVLLIMTSIKGLNIIHFNYVFLIILAYWIRLAFLQFKSYRNKLQEAIDKKEHTERIFDESTNLGILSNAILKNPKDHFSPLYYLIEKSEPANTEFALEHLLNNANNKMKEILQEITNNKIVEAVDLIEDIIKNSKRDDIQEVLVTTSNSLGQIEDIRFEKLEQMCRSNNPAERLYAVRLLVRTGRYNTFRLLIDLLQDKNVSVRKAALRASGKIKRHELWIQIIDHLHHPDYINEAFAAIEEIGKPILKELDMFFGKISENKEIQTRIIKLYEKIGGAEATELLKNKINHHDKEIRHQVLLALSRLEYRATLNETPSIKQYISEEISIIIWLMASMNDIGNTDEAADLRSAIDYELTNKRENIFLLLSLIYDPKIIKHVREKIQSKDNDARVYALEIIDMTVSEDLKNLIIPILDDITIKETINAYETLFPQKKLDISERLKDILNKDYSKINVWTKSCALELMPRYPCKDSDQQYAANLINPNTIIIEIAAKNLYNSDMEKFLEISVKLAKDFGKKLERISKALIRKNKQTLDLTIDKTRTIKNIELFRKIPEIDLLKLAYSASEHNLMKGENLEYNINDQKLLLIESGKLIVNNDELRLSFETNEIIAEILPEIWDKKGLKLQATEKTEILILDIDILYSMLTDYPEISKAIVNNYY